MVAQSLCHGLENGVTASEAVSVVDASEVVDVHEGHDAVFGPAVGLEERVDRTDEAVPVVEPVTATC